MNRQQANEIAHDIEHRLGVWHSRDKLTAARRHFWRAGIRSKFDALDWALAHYMTRAELIQAELDAWDATRPSIQGAS